MKKITFYLSILLLYSCQNFGNLTLLTDLPKSLKEVSGIEAEKSSNLLWMINDGGNSAVLYGISKNGKIKKEIKVNAKNHDWEDLTTDESGNVYIGDFGNNVSKRKNLSVLKINHNNLLKKKVEVEKIKFYYPNQYTFPPKKSKRFFDAEAFFYLKDSLYIFTKSRVKNHFGKTSLYRIPASKGNYKAEFISEFNHCNELECWITSAAISPNKEKVVLLTPKKVLVFTNFKNDNFFSGELTEIPLGYVSQKESITFKNNNTVFITDEKSHLKGGNLYELEIN
ncbi:hypothetical protein OD91_1288 [Lutibacter sp. Hel_I_33_5]|uniref:hypothetical protein n=1 Tax=Lutibacter sp. Hel_I_33_5 TaxID=1566289 RepID=UPI00119D08BD|nr:hypothetical protein [Lutibacter sp. Hel_I_33_5]TVZ56009.1 hypothetical protein OD91_1288 [Lutibacter sp. Hel_I_33_5]